VQGKANPSDSITARRICKDQPKSIKGTRWQIGKARMEGFCCNHTMKEFQYYMRGSKFPEIVKSDYRNLRMVTTTKELNAHQARGELCAYNFLLERIKGKENVVADALSRRPDCRDESAIEFKETENVFE
jgi:hypothetical protein